MSVSDQQLLTALVEALEQCGQWQQQAPSAEALASKAPFACDSMSFANWLQFIFIPRCQQLLDHGGALPACALLPMAEMQWQGQSGCELLLVVLQAIDEQVAGR
jgi:uncharacterized protein YqcC (DUF446 family)